MLVASQEAIGATVPASNDACNTCSVSIDIPPYEAPPPSYAVAMGEVLSVNDPPPAYTTIHPETDSNGPLQPSTETPRRITNPPPVVIRATPQPKSKCSGCRITAFITIIIIKIIIIGSLADRKRSYVATPSREVYTYSFEPRPKDYSSPFESHPKDYSGSFYPFNYRSDDELSDFLKNNLLTSKVDRDRFLNMLVNRSKHLTGSSVSTNSPELKWKMD